MIFTSKVLSIITANEDKKKECITLAFTGDIQENNSATNIVPTSQSGQTNSLDMGDGVIGTYDLDENTAESKQFENSEC